jgi:hypothetical protein
MTTQKQIDDGGSVTADLISERYVAGIGTVQEKVQSVGGLSLRDYFAAAALTSVIQQSNFYDRKSCQVAVDKGRITWNEMRLDNDAEGLAGESENIAYATYMIADAMLAARKEGA